MREFFLLLCLCLRLETASLILENWEQLGHFAPLECQKVCTAKQHNSMG
jgi:hypothetical protein